MCWLSVGLANLARRSSRRLCVLTAGSVFSPLALRSRRRLCVLAVRLCVLAARFSACDLSSRPCGSAWSITPMPSDVPDSARRLRRPADSARRDSAPADSRPADSATRPTLARRLRPPTPPADSARRLRPPTPPADSARRLRPPTPPADSARRLRPPTPPADSAPADSARRLRPPTRARQRAPGATYSCVWPYTLATAPLPVSLAKLRMCRPCQYSAFSPPALRSRRRLCVLTASPAF